MTQRWCWLLPALLLNACILLPQPATTVEPAAQAAGPIAPTCGPGLPDNKDAGTLDAHALRLVNWNVHKVTERGSLEDLRRFSANADLVLIQEALLTPTLLAAANGRIKDAETFIDRVASKSSWTDRAYQVDCADKELLARDWLYAELQRIRDAGT